MNKICKKLIWLIFIINVIFSTSTYAYQLNYSGVEVMKNGGFEEGFFSFSASEWVSQNCSFKRVKDARSGTYAAQVTTKSDDTSVIKSLVELDLDSWYEVSVYIKLLNVSELLESDSVCARFINHHYTTYTDKNGDRVTGSTDVEHMGLKFYDIDSSGWQKISYVYTPKSWYSRYGTDPQNGNGYLYLQCDVFSNHGATGHKIPGYPITYLLDDFSVKKLNPNNINISGNKEIEIPEDETLNEYYTAFETIELESESCPIFEDSNVEISACIPKEGVSFSNGVLSVSPNAVEQTVTLTATNGDINSTFEINIVEELTDSAQKYNKTELLKNLREAIYLYTGAQSGNKTAFINEINEAYSVCAKNNLKFQEGYEAKKKLEQAIFDFKRSMTPYANVYVDAAALNEGDGSVQNPFKTITDAKEYVRSISPQMTGDIIVNIASGTYLQTDTAQSFTPADSGRNGFSVIYRGNDNTVVTGGEEISTNVWSLYENGIYRTNIGKDKTIRQLYVNDKRAIRARSTGPIKNIVQTNEGYTTDDLTIAGFQRPLDVELVYVNAWENPRATIKSVVRNENTLNITLNETAWKTIGKYSDVNSKLLYYENAYELLDEPGEWYYNCETGYLYYMPRDGENEINAVYPLRDGELFYLSGVDENNVIHDIIFENISFKYATWNYPTQSGCYIDNQDNHVADYGKRPPAAITVNYGHNVNISGCAFEHLGSMGINLEYAIQNCVVEKSKFSDISANAISIGSADYYNRINWIYPDNYYYLPADEKYYVKNNNICENTIENVAVEYRGAAAVSGGFLIDTDIAYNDISETAYSAIHINWGWNYINTSCTSNVRIHHNYIKNALNSYMADGGAIYVLGPTSGKVRCSINNNYIDGVFSKTNYVYGSALYLDEGASHWDVHSNVINLYETNSTYFTNKNWISSLEENKKENHIYNNFISNYSRHHCDTEVGNYVKNTTICTDLNWTDEALEIISGAGTKGKEGQN